MIDWFEDLDAVRQALAAGGFTWPITLHNIPEELAVGVAFGAAASGVEGAGATTLAAAVALALPTSRPPRRWSASAS